MAGNGGAARPAGTAPPSGAAAPPSSRPPSHWAPGPPGPGAPPPPLLFLGREKEASERHSLSRARISLLSDPVVLRERDTEEVLWAQPQGPRAPRDETSSSGGDRLGTPLLFLFSALVTHQQLTRHEHHDPARDGGLGVDGGDVVLAGLERWKWK